MKIPIKKAEAFFLENGEYDFHSLWKPPTLFFSCKASNLWRRCLEAVENPNANKHLVSGPNENDPPADAEAIDGLAQKIVSRSATLHGEIKENPLGLTIVTLTMAVLDTGMGRMGRTIGDNPYRTNARNTWAQTLSQHLVALCGRIHQEKNWHAGPLAFYHIMNAVRQFQPLALELEKGDRVFRTIADVLLQSQSIPLENTHSSGPPPVPVSAGGPVVNLDGSQIFDFLTARNKWRRSADSRPQNIVAGSDASFMNVLPARWRQEPPDIWIGMCGSSYSGKTSIYTSLFNLNSYKPEVFQGMNLKSSREMSAILETMEVVPNARTVFIGSGNLTTSGQKMFFVDIKGGDLFQEETAADIEIRAQSSQPPGGAAPAEGNPLSVRDVATRSDLLVLTIGPDEVESTTKLRRLTERLRGVIAAADRKHAMICVAFTKADDYGLASPLNMQRLCFQRSLSRHGSPDDAWRDFMEQVTPVEKKSRQERLRNHLLGIVKEKLWNSLWDNVTRGGARQKWVGPFGVYLLSPLPEDDAYSSQNGDADQVRWHSLGVSTLFQDFFALYTPPKQLRPMSKILSDSIARLSASGRSVFSAAIGRKST